MRLVLRTGLKKTSCIPSPTTLILPFVTNNEKSKLLKLSVVNDVNSIDAKYL